MDILCQPLEYTNAAFLSSSVFADVEVGLPGTGVFGTGVFPAVGTPCVEVTVGKVTLVGVGVVEGSVEEALKQFRVPVSVNVLPASGTNLPVITGRMQRQLENTIGIGVTHNAIRPDRSKCIVILSAGTDNELLDAVRVRRAARVLRSKTFIVMIVTVQHDLGARGI